MATHDGSPAAGLPALLYGLAQAFLGRVTIVARGLRRCAFAALAVLLVNAMFAYVPQGRELLALTVEGGRAHRLWPHALLAAAAALSLIVWYSGRVLMRLGDLIDPEQETADLHEFEQRLATWLPRALGLLCVAPFAVYVAEAGGRDARFAAPWLIVAMITSFAALDVLMGVVRRGFYGGAFAAMLLLAVVAHRWSVELPFDQALAWRPLLRAVMTGAPDGHGLHWRATGVQLILTMAAMGIIDLVLAWLGRYDDLGRSRLASRWQRRAWALLLLLLGIGAFLGWSAVSDDGRYPRTAWVVALLSLASILLAAFVVYRARVFPGVTHAAAPLDASRRGRRRLSGVTWIILLASVAVGMALTLAACLRPLETGRAIGAPALVLMSAALWCVLGGVVLTIVPRTFGLPSLAWLLAVPVAITALLGGPVLISTASAAASGRPGGDTPDGRLDVVDAYRAWSDGRPAGDTGPIYLVAAAGGGIRAAFLTASFLAAADDLTRGEFGGRVFVVSGVSGGSLGAAVYAATRLPEGRPAGADPACLEAAAGAPLRLGPRQAFVHCALGADFLSPTVATFLFHDLVKDFAIPLLPTQDRGRTLEQAWTEALEGEAPGPFQRPFLGFGAPSRGVHRLPGAWVPHLVLNATSIQSGVRVLASTLTWPPSAAIDIFSPGFETRGLTLAGAVHNSARFPLVSPVGAYAWRPVPAPADGEPPRWGQVADGGYFDNSGGLSLVEIIQALPEPARTRVRVISITNDGEERLVCGALGDGAGGLDPQLTAPLTTMLATRTARAELSKDQLNQALTARGPCGDFFVEVTLNKHRLAAYLRKVAAREGRPVSEREISGRVREPPLGWALAAGTSEWLGAYALDAARMFTGPGPAAPGPR